MNKRLLWLSLLALAVGFGLGLTYAWLISPLRIADDSPRALRADFKDHFRAAIAAAYASSGDLERARARLALLGDPDPAQALTAQAQRMLASGESLESVRQVALLASILQGQQVAPPSLTISPTVPAALSNSLAITTTSTPAPVILVTETQPPEASLPIATSTPRPTRTPTATLGAPYQLVGQDTLCDSDLPEGLLQVIVLNAVRRPVPGAEIIVAWGNGEEHFFTGLKPELGKGYADFVMAPETMYSVRMADGGTPASDLSAPLCTATDGSSYYGGLRITFQQP
ncbi:MAG: hypothetical protein Fur0043_22800 [Anaerolineales bacterium]